MQHHAALEHVGSYWGHVVPGLLFLGWGLHWHWVSLRGKRLRHAVSSSLFTPLETAVLMVAAAGGALGEVWWPSWRMTDSALINYQHATMYLSFALAGAADLAIRAGRLHEGVERWAAALAFGLTALQFAVHSEHSPLSAALHRLLALLLVVSALVFLFDLRSKLARPWLLSAAGVWFLVIAWLLYRSGIDVASPVAPVRANLFFSWTVMGTGLLLAGSRALFNAGDGAAGSASS